MKQILLATTLFLSILTQAQVNIATEDFETTASSTPFGFTFSNGSFVTGNTALTAIPANLSQVFNGTRAYQVSGQTATLTSGPLNTLGHNFVTLRMRLMAVALDPLANAGGPDKHDYVRIYISPNNGTTWFKTLEVRGNNGSTWAYNALGNANTSYDGNSNAATFEPAGSGLRTIDGYSTLTINHLPQTANLRVRIVMSNSWGNNEAQKSWIIDQVRLVGTVQAPLPVKFSDIKASQKGSGVQIDWTSFAEENVDRYEIERSVNGRDFVSVGTVQARNSGSNKINYTFYDASPVQGTNFYRLKNVDVDAKNGFSNIVRLDLAGSAAEIGIYPNPVQSNGQVAIRSSHLPKGTYKVDVFNMMGQPVRSLQFNHQGGAVTQAVQLQGMNPGTYTIQLANDEARLLVKPFIIH